MVNHYWKEDIMLTFAWPFMFLLLPLLWLVQRYFPSSQKQNEAMLMVPFFARISSLDQASAANSSYLQLVRQLLNWLAWALLIVACANPQWLGDLIPISQEGRNIMLAIDLSPSMEIPDLQRDNRTINRLETVKEVAKGFITKRQGDKLGLILFASKAYLQTPLTYDLKTVDHMLDDATIGLAGERTAIGNSIALAIKKFSTENVKSRILILLTDGGNNAGEIDPAEAAKLAKENQIKIYTVGIGANQMLIDSIFGRQLVNPSADLDEDLLKKIASSTDGQYFRAQDDKTLASIMESINQLEPISTESSKARPITALFYWPLAGSLLMFCLLLFPKLSKK